MRKEVRRGLVDGNEDGAHAPVHLGQAVGEALAEAMASEPTGIVESLARGGQRGDGELSPLHHRLTEDDEACR